MMRQRVVLPVLVVGLMVTASAVQAQAQYPVLTLVANKVIQRYQSSTCEELWANRGKQPGPQEQRLISLLNGDPQLQQAFFNQIAGPVMTKMFSCGMIP